MCQINPRDMDFGKKKRDLHHRNSTQMTWLSQGRRKQPRKNSIPTGQGQKTAKKSTLGGDVPKNHSAKENSWGGDDLQSGAIQRKGVKSGSR